MDRVQETVARKVRCDTRFWKPVFLLLALVLFAGVTYDTMLVKQSDQLRFLTALILVSCLAGALLLQEYPERALRMAFVRAWPLHLFTISFFSVCLAFHGGFRLEQVLVYTIFAYALFMLVPLLLVLNPGIMSSFFNWVAILSAIMAIPALFGAAGIETILGIPLRVKPSYRFFSGIIATGGFFEHPEGLAFQMAIGLFCSLYGLRSGRKSVFFPCLLLTLAGLIVSQGRAAIMGVAIAFAFRFLPELFRRSRTVFLGTLLFLTLFPFVIWSQLAVFPGVSGYFRLERGLSGRDVAWGYAFLLIEQRPWVGYGFMASTNLTEVEDKWLRSLGFSGGGSTFHNTFISKAVDLGLIATFCYSLIYLVPLLRTSRIWHPRHEQELVRSVILLTLVTGLFRDYNIGGIRSTSMLGAMFLGLTNVWPLLSDYGRKERVKSEFDLPD